MVWSVSVFAIQLFNLTGVSISSIFLYLVTKALVIPDLIYVCKRSFIFKCLSFTLWMFMLTCITSFILTFRICISLNCLYIYISLEFFRCFQSGLADLMVPYLWSVNFVQIYLYLLPIGWWFVSLNAFPIEVRQSAFWH